MSRLFKRTSAVTIIPSKEALGELDTAFAITVRHLRVQFNIEKNLGKEPNTCTVKITNFAERTRALLERKPTFVQIEAGYDGAVRQVFAGDIRFADSVRDGPDWVTTLELADGGRAFRNARVNRSFSRNVKSRRVAVDVIRTMGFPIPKEIRLAPELEQRYTAGISLEGSSYRELTRILARGDLTFSVQDGRLQVLRERDTHKGASWPISEDTGMVGTPAFGSPPKEGKPRTLQVATKLFPQLIPGGRIEMQAARIRGPFKLTRVAHDGDTHGPVWDTKLEAIPLS